MSVKNRLTLLNEIAQYINDNASNEISAADVRQRLIDIVDSCLNLTTDGGAGLRGYNTFKTYNTGDTVIYNGFIYIAFADGLTGTWDPKKWVVIGGGLTVLQYAAINSNTQLIALADGYELEGITIENESGDATGNINIGTTATGGEVLIDEVIPTTGSRRKYFDRSQLMTANNPVSNTYYISSDNWGTGSVKVHLHIKQVIL